MSAPSSWRHLQGNFVGARLVSAHHSAGAQSLIALAGTEAWDSPDLEMVDFAIPASVRRAPQKTYPQWRALFRDVRVVAGMAGIADLRNAEYVCDAVHDNCSRLDTDWYVKYGLNIGSGGDCQVFCGNGEPLQVEHAVCFFGWENGNYAHWLSEKLARFHWIQQADLPPHTLVLVEEGLPASIMDSLALFWPREKTLCVPRGQGCDVRVLYHFSDSAEIWEPRPGYVYAGDEYRICPRAIAWMAQQVKSACGVTSCNLSKTYLVRSPGGNGRTIVNQDLVVQHLQSMGFQALRPETFSFAEQVARLSSVELAILGSGAAAANLLWMPKGSTLVILIQDNPQMWYRFFHALAAAVGVRLVYFPVTALPGTHPVLFHRSVEILVEPLLRWIEADAPARYANLERAGTPIQDILPGERFPALEKLRKGLSRLRRVKDMVREPPLVSVCIGAYNHERYIAQAIDSVLQQTYPNIEIIVVDDASSDGTAAIVRGYAERFPERVRAILLDRNEGPARAPNRAFADAKGEYIALLGSDDRMLPARILRQVEFLTENSEHVAVFTDITAIDANGQRIAGSADAEQLFNQPITHLHRQLLTGNFLNAPSAMVRRADLMALGGYSPLLRYVQDYELWVRLLQRGDIGKLAEPLVEYRVHGANLSIFGSQGPNFAARCETVSVIVQLVRESSLSALLDRPLTSPADRVGALLELAELLKQVDRHYFGKPALACAQAYQLVLEASRLDAQACMISKADLETCLDQGFEHAAPPQDRRHFTWFGNASTAVDASSDELPFTVRGWVEARVPTPVQSRMIEEHLRTIGDPLLAVIVIDLQGDESKVAATLASLALADAPGSVLPLVLSTVKEVTGEGLGFQRMLINPEELAATLNQVVGGGGFDWLMLIEAGTTFTVGGLLCARLELAAAQGLQAVYADELLSDARGDLGAVFRPSFNLDLLLSLPSAMARHWLFGREALEGLGGFDDSYPAALELELITRLIEQYGTASIGHLDEPLLIAAAPSLEDVADEVRVIERHLQRRGYGHAQVLEHLPGRYRLHYGHVEQPLVSIIVPTKDQLPMLLRCVTSLLEKTRYLNYELLIVDNNSETPEALAWLDGVARMDASKVRVLRYPHPFNYSAINNMAAREAKGEYLVLLNNDTAIVQEDWLENLLNHGQRPEVGIVGAKLFYPDGRIQHAGVVLGLRGPSEHPFCGLPGDDAGYMQRLQVDQNYSAVTAACLLIRKSVYDEVGGLDEQAFKVSYNDVDLCLKVREAGYLTVWTPHARVIHEGSVSQKAIDPGVQEAKLKRFTAEQDAMYAKWLPLIARDPAYNPNLSLNGNGFEMESDTDLTWRPLSWRPLPVVMAHMGDMTGCGHYRIIKPFNAMEESGLIDGKLSQIMLDMPDFARYAPDAIVVQRQLSEHFHGWVNRVKTLTNTFKVYELDDYLPNLPLKSVHRGTFSKDVLKSLRKSLGFVDRFVVSTEPLAEALEGMHPNIRVMHNRLPLDWWGDLSSQRRQGRKPRVGWAGGSGHTGDLELIIDVVKDLADEVDWVFLGMCPEGLLPYLHEFHPGVHIDLYPAKLASLNLDLALAPLEDNLFNRCKSNLRLLEYGICGFPVVCSDIEPYRTDLPVTRVRNRYKEWGDAIRAHLQDLEGAAAMGDALQARVRAEWMLEGDNLLAWRKAWLPD